jgi:oligoendopeptidase F
MMFSSLPATVDDFQFWPWSEIDAYYKDLASRSLSDANIKQWLTDWSAIKELVTETYNRLYVASTCNTTDNEVERRFMAYLEDIFPNSEAADQVLKEKLLQSGLQVEGLEQTIQNIRSEVSLFNPQNLPLLAEERHLGTEYDRIIGAQSIQWQDKEVTLSQLLPVYLDNDRHKREQAWRMASQRQLQDRQAINELWGRYMGIRRKLAENAGQDNYRSYRWKQLHRFDYTPNDCQALHQVIEQVVVPAATRIYDAHRRALGLDNLRPWDMDWDRSADPRGRPPLQPFETVAELEEQASIIFQRVDPQLGHYFNTMRQNDLLDLENRKDKAPGGYCIDYPRARLPFIFMNSVGIHEDVQTILHEGGHAFHVFETGCLPYYQQKESGIEFAEVASTAMELLSAPYLTRQEGGFYSPEEAARARIEHLKSFILFWPYMAVVDAFQHWVYENHTLASDPDNCDRKWTELWIRFLPDVDWSGFEEVMSTGWQRKAHILQVPFYYIEYGLAGLGAIQVFSNSLTDHAGAVQGYRKALSLGGTVPLPVLFKTAGASFSFSRSTLANAVNLLEGTIASLESI